jgi:PAS domain S-box-containing protein
MALKREITAKIKGLLRERPQGLSITEIVRIININRNTAGRYLENLMVSGQVEMRHFGMAKIYRLAQRVPLSAMLSISSELIMLLDDSLRVIYANEPLLKFHETTQNDLYGKNIDYTPCVSVFDDAFDTLKKHMKAGLAGKEWFGELSLKNKEIVFSCRIAPTVFEDGQRGVSVLFENITERKQAEQALRESEAQYRSLAEASQDLIFMVDRNDIVTYVNSFAAAMLGKEPGAVIGKVRASLFPPDLAQRQVAGLRRVFMSGQPARSDGPMPVNGDVRWFDHFLVPVLDTGGRVISVLGVSRDITGRKETEEALRQSEGKLHAMLQSMTDPMNMMDEDLTIIWANDTAKRYFGADIVGRKCYEAFHQRQTPCEPYPCLALKAFRDGKMHRHETAVIDAHGQTRFFECTTNVALRDKGGKPVAVLEISRDITDRKRAEEALCER